MWIKIQEQKIAQYFKSEPYDGNCKTKGQWFEYKVHHPRRGVIIETGYEGRKQMAARMDG